VTYLSEMSEDKEAEGFATVVRNAKGKNVSIVIKSALGNPGTYSFGSLLNEPAVLELDTMPSEKPWLDLLKVFAYGTFASYKGTQEALKLPPLSAEMTTKLKRLTIVTHAGANKILAYDLLLKELEISNVRELEDMIIDCVYLGLIKGKLDQKKRAFEVSSAMGRDIGPDDLDYMLAKLGSWSSVSQQTLEALEKRIKEANEAKVKEKDADADFDSKKKLVVEDMKQRQKEAEAQGGGGGMAGMQNALGAIMGAIGMDRGDRRGGPRGAAPAKGRTGGFGPGNVMGMGFRH